MRPRASVAYLGFAAFGVVWGVWGASVPRVQARAGVDDGRLGLALLCIGVGALPAMMVAGRLVDRFGDRAVAVFLAVLGVTAASAVGYGTTFVRLCVGLLVLGAVSGASDVGINAVAGRFETVTRRRVIARCHGVFSAAVVMASLVSGACVALGADVMWVFVVAAAVCVVAAAVVTRPDVSAKGELSGRGPGVAQPGFGRPPRSGSGLRSDQRVVLVLLGGLGALALATENAHQSWSAVFAHDQLGAGTALAAGAPAIFAGCVALSRLGLSVGSTRHDSAVLRRGAALAAAGGLVVAVAPDLAVDSVGLALAAGGTAVLFPTLLGIAARNLPDISRGRGTSVVTGVAYLGFVLGPAYVGGCASIGGLRVAMAGVALLPVVLLAGLPPVLRALANRDRLSDADEPAGAVLACPPHAHEIRP